MSDRVRRLDALFAEKVLGKTNICRCGQPCLVVGFNDAAEPVCGNGHVIPCYYTRCLDVAWEGASSKQSKIEFCCRDIHGDHDYIYKASVAFDNDGHCKFDARSCDHPAEALVLACLRAVGCSEEELT